MYSCYIVGRKGTSSMAERNTISIAPFYLSRRYVAFYDFYFNFYLKWCILNSCHDNSYLKLSFYSSLDWQLLPPYKKCRCGGQVYFYMQYKTRKIKDINLCWRPRLGMYVYLMWMFLHFVDVFLCSLPLCIAVETADLRLVHIK